MRHEYTDESGKEHTYETDSEANFIRHLLECLMRDYGISGSVAVIELGDRWVKVAITLMPPSKDGDDAINFYTDLEQALGGGKGWYECKESGESPKNVYWWVTRHIGGPYI